MAGKVFYAQSQDSAKWVTIHVIKRKHHMEFRYYRESEDLMAVEKLSFKNHPELRGVHSLFGWDMTRLRQFVDPVDWVFEPNSLKWEVCGE